MRVKISLPTNGFPLAHLKLAVVRSALPNANGEKGEKADVAL